MDTLIQDALELLKEISKTTTSVFATSEEIAYFGASSVKYPAKKNPQQTAPPPSVVIPTQTRSEPPQIPTPPPKPVETAPSKPPIEKKQLSDMRQLIQKIFPDWALRETIPDDTIAKRMSRLWEETYLSAHVVIIAFGEVGPGMEFLKHVTAAVNTLLAPAQLIEGSILEKERGWDLLLSSPTLKTVVCSPWSSWKTTSLAKHYLQNGTTQEQFLGKHRLLLLEPSLIYLKHPERKRELWKTLSTHLSS